MIHNSSYPDAGSSRPQMIRDADGWENALRKDGFPVDSVNNAMRSDMTHTE
ncbi:MAG: hypothetical protein P4M05_32890 [Bradyrhizobium sp.]|nr:hypothetical protein [Bradyrhizobium sp.]